MFWARWLLAIIGTVCASIDAQAAAPAWQPPVTRAMVTEQFVLFDPDYVQLKTERQRKLAELERQLFALQAEGEPMFCSAHMINELRWLLQSTTQWSRIDHMLWLVRLSLAEKDQHFAMNQESHDGSWGLCYQEWFKKLDPMIQSFNRMAGKDVPPTYTFLEFLKPIATPADLVGYLERARVSDIAKTGLNRRDELGAVTSVVAEIVHKEHVRDYLARNVQGIELGPDYADAYVRFIDDWQDPETGYWGPWYRIGGEVRKAADLSFTYHIIAYRRGDVARWDKVLATTLAIRDQEYPYGWRYGGKLNNHNAYDVVRILELGWPHMDEGQRHEAADAVEGLLDWSLSPDSLDASGSFVTRTGFDSSVSDAQYYGVSMLTKAGYCNTKPPFWTGRTFPEAKATCCRIAARLGDLGAEVPAAQAARDRLAVAFPVCGMAKP